MKQVSGKEFVRLLQKRGWLLKRVNGSHHILTKAGHRERIVIPVHGNQPIETWVAETSNENRRTYRGGFVIGWHAGKT